jgi:Flp pilus assembly protein TadD
VKGQQLVEKGDDAGAAEHLRKALEIDPDFMEAHNNLGCRYMALGDLQNAVAEFHKAIALDAESALAHSNLAVALLQLHQAPEAETESRLALKLDPTATKGYYVLAMSLYTQQKYTKEAFDLLHRSEQEFPNASIAAARAFYQIGAVDQAKVALKTYLKSGSPERRSEVEAWLNRLK